VVAVVIDIVPTSLCDERFSPSAIFCLS